MLLIALLVLAVAIGGYFWKQNNALGKTNTELSAEVGTLRELRTDLLADIEELQADYSDLMTSNDSLSLVYKETTKTVEVQKVEISKIKKEFAKDAAGMKAEVEQLRNFKKELTALVGQLKDEIAQLKESNQALTGQVAGLELQVSELRQMNTDLERDKKKWMAVSTRATNLRIDIRKKEDKPTGSHRRAKEIIVSFDVRHLPEAKKGEHHVYLVIKDAKGVPVAVANPVKTTIKPDAGGQPEEIIAQQMQMVDLNENTRIQFKINPKEKSLHAGYYRVAIYTEWGLLGGAEFQLK